MFCLTLYILTGLFLFLVEMKTLDSLGMFNMIVDEILEMMSKEVEVREEDESSARTAILVALSIAYVILWPVFLFIQK